VLVKTLLFVTTENLEFPVPLKCTHFPKVLEPPQNSGRQKGDMKRVPH